MDHRRCVIQKHCAHATADIIRPAAVFLRVLQVNFAKCIKWKKTTQTRRCRLTTCVVYEYIRVRWQWNICGGALTWWLPSKKHNYMHWGFRDENQNKKKTFFLCNIEYLNFFENFRSPFGRLLNSLQYAKIRKIFEVQNVSKGLACDPNAYGNTQSDPKSPNYHIMSLLDDTGDRDAWNGG